MAPMIMQHTIAVMPMPPYICPTILRQNFSNLLPICPFPITLAAKIKNGRHRVENLFNPAVKDETAMIGCIFSTFNR